MAVPAMDRRVLDRLAFDLADGPDPRARAPVQRWLRSVSLVRSPWDTAIVLLVAAGLYAVVVVGSWIIVIGGGAWINLVVGAPVVAVGVGLSAHLVPERRT